MTKQKRTSKTPGRKVSRKGLALTLCVLVVLVLLSAAAALQQRDTSTVVLAEETFEDLPMGFFSLPVTPLYEYHYVRPERRRGRWEDAVIMGGTPGARYWLVDAENDRFMEHNRFMEQTIWNARKWSSPMLVTGDPEWADYTVEARVRPLATREHAGLVFRYKNNRNYYLLALEDGARLRLLRREEEIAFHQPQWIKLGEALFGYHADEFVALRVENQGEQMRCFANGKLLLEARDGAIRKGKVGLLANMPARFDDVRVTTTAENARAIAARIAARQGEEEKLRSENPRAVLWKKLETPRRGTGRSVRFGDLDGDGQLDMVLAQNVPRVRGDAYDMISYLTAMTLDGRMLWHIGHPSREHALLTNDIPVQIHDIDGDGKNEVVFVKDLKIQVVEGSTGKLKQWAWTPPASKAEDAFDRTHGDSLLFVNVSGNKTPRDLLVKDRYNKFWVFDSNLKLLWSAECKTGHYPFAYDLDGDGREEIFVGYTLFTPDGRRVWTLDTVLEDHADAVAAGRWTEDGSGPITVLISGSDEGFVHADTAGQILKHVRVGHAQALGVGKFRPDLSGLQFAVGNFWGNPGIVTIFDSQANVLLSLEPTHYGNPLFPVNWTGDGREFLFLNGDPKEGGLLDGWGRRVVMFPDDGHPVLTAYVANVTGDERDEIVLWDQDRMWIYTQDRPFTGKRIYAPRRNPHYNESNYRANISLPAWRDRP